MGLINSNQTSPATQLNWSHNLVKNVSMDQIPEPVASTQPRNHQQPVPRLKCPRCDSTNTKFCYYNNYSRTQPRHFCKACKRHWTEGGTLRNVPVGGGRKNKRTKTTPTSYNKNNTSNPISSTQFEQQQQQGAVVPDLIGSAGDQKSDDIFAHEFLQLMRHPPEYGLSGWLPAQFGSTAAVPAATVSSYSSMLTCTPFSTLPIYTTSATACSTTSASAWPGSTSGLDSSCDYWSAGNWDDDGVNGLDAVEPDVRPTIADGSHSPRP